MTISRTLQIVYDIDHNYGQDLIFSVNGDLLSVSGTKRGEERVLRRLFTNPVDYIWHTEYGAGLPAAIGKTLDLDFFDQIKSLITSQIFLEPSVSQNPPPNIFLQTIPAGLFSQIEYTDNPTQQPVVLLFDV